MPAQILIEIKNRGSVTMHETGDLDLIAEYGDEVRILVEDAISEYEAIYSKPMKFWENFIAKLIKVSAKKEGKRAED